MTTASILNDYLAAGLLPIGEDDQKLELLEKAATALAARLQADPTLTHRFTLVGLDVTASDADPVHRLANEALIEEWKTISNRVGASPVQIHRALLLRAIELTTNNHAKLAALPRLVLSNIEPQYNTTETAALKPFLARMATIAETLRSRFLP